MTTGPWRRRARPGLGTLVDVGVSCPDGDDREDAIEAAFASIARTEAVLSRFAADSDIARFQALPIGGGLALRPEGVEVFAAAHALRSATGGLFDITLGTAPDGWRIDGEHLLKLHAGARFDLGGIAKGHAVDRAVAALRAHGVESGWVNAGGDLRAFGDAEVPVMLRDEATGGTRAFAKIRDGAFATSHFGAGTRAQARSPVGSRPSGAAPVAAHASVAAPLCLWADALTKVVAISGRADHPLLARYDAWAWLHGAGFNPSA